jgi:transposase
MKPQNNHLDFCNQEFYVGIDTHLKNWKVTIRFNGIELKTFSMNPSPRELFNYLNKNYPNGNYHLVYEAGFSGFWPVREFNNLGLHCIVVNPADVPTSNKEKVNKCDPIDSRKLARELENNSLKGIFVPNIFQEELRDLMRLRFRIVQNQTRIKNRIKSFLHTKGIKIPLHFTGNKRWSYNFIIWLEELNLSSSAGNFTLKNMVLQFKVLREQNKLVLQELRQQAKSETILPIIDSLISVPGVGFITAMTLFTEIMDINRFPNQDKTDAFVGLVPSISSSDDNIYTNGISFRDNKFLRPLLIEAAWMAIRTDPALTLKYKELTMRMKPQLAIVRIAKKLLSRIRHVWVNLDNYEVALVA